MAFTSGQWGPDTFIDNAGNTVLIGATVTASGYVCTVDELGNLTIVGPADDSVTVTVTPATGAAYTATVAVKPTVEELDTVRGLAVAAETPAGAQAKADAAEAAAEAAAAVLADAAEAAAVATAAADATTKANAAEAAAEATAAAELAAAQLSNTATFVSLASAGAFALTEDLDNSLILSTGSITTATTLPVMVATQTVELSRVALAFTSAVAGSTTDYWTVTLRRNRGLPVDIVTKTTRPVTTGGDGEPITALTGWLFDGLEFSDYAVLEAGDVLTVTLTPTGAPSALVAPLLTFLAAPTDTASPADPADNIVTNPSFETDTTGWLAGGGTLTRVASGGWSGPAHARLTATGATGRFIRSNPSLTGPLEGETWTVQYRVKGTVGRESYAAIECRNGGGSLGSLTPVPRAILTADWQQFSYTTPALLAGTTEVRIFIYLGNTGGQVGDVLDVDAVKLNQGALSAYTD